MLHFYSFDRFLSRRDSHRTAADRLPSSTVALSRIASTSAFLTAA